MRRSTREVSDSDAETKKREDSSCPTEKNNGEHMPQEQFQRVKQNQNPSPESSEEDQGSTVTACTRNEAIRNQRHDDGKRLSKSKILPVQAVVNEAARDQEGNGDAGGSRTPKRTRTAKSAMHQESNKIATVLNNIHQFEILAHRLNRSRSAQEINQHVTDGIKAKNYSKSETEMVDVVDTLQRTIPIIEKEIAKNLTFLHKEIDTEREQRHGSAHHDEDLKVTSFANKWIMKITQTQWLMMMRAYHRADPHTFHRGNTAAKYSQLHMSAEHDHEHERIEHTMSRLPTNTHKGWIFATESPWTLWHTSGSRQDTHGTPVPEIEGRGWPDTSSTTRRPTNENTTKDRSE